MQKEFVRADGSAVSFPVPTVRSVQVLAELERLCLNPPWPPELLTGSLEAPGGGCLFVTGDGMVHEAESPRGAAACGFVLYRLPVGVPTPDVPEAAELLRLGIAPGFRRKGLARALMERLCSLAFAVTDRLLVEVSAQNEPGVALYRACGFEPIHRRPKYYTDGTDALVLEKRRV